MPRIKTFIWQHLHNNIGVGECLARRGINVSDVCPLCQRDSESILHMLRDCEFVRLLEVFGAIWELIRLVTFMREAWVCGLKKTVRIIGVG